MSLPKIVNKLKGEFFFTLFANIFSYLITFCGSIIYVRLLGKHDFGVYTFAFNIISLFLLLNGFGAASGVLQYVSRAKDQFERVAVLQFAFKIGIFFNLLIALFIIAYALIFPLPIPAARPILLTMALFPVGRLYIDIFQAYLRASGQNRIQGYFLIINNSLLLLANIAGIMLFHLYGLIYFTYIAYVVMLIFSSWKFKLPTIIGFAKKDTSLINRKQFISYSFFTTLANAFSGLLFVLDIIIISYIVKEPQLIANYRVATIIPFAINFIPNIAVNYFYPEFAKNAHDPAKIRQLSRYIFLRMFAFSGATSFFLILLAKPLILLIFGKSYQDSILPFQIISFGYWIIASFRTINGNILAAMGKARLSFYLTGFILVVNIIVTYLMVKYYSINGAAIAVVFMYAFSSFIGYIALKLVLRNLEPTRG